MMSGRHLPDVRPIWADAIAAIKVGQQPLMDMIEYLVTERSELIAEVERLRAGVLQPRVLWRGETRGLFGPVDRYTDAARVLPDVSQAALLDVPPGTRVVVIEDTDTPPRCACTSGADLGFSEDSGYAHLTANVHPDCPVHGDTEAQP